MASEEARNEYENGLRILARWIARAHLKALARQENPTVTPDPAGSGEDPGEITGSDFSQTAGRVKHLSPGLTQRRRTRHGPHQTL